MQSLSDTPPRWAFLVILAAGTLIAVDQLSDWLLAIYPFEFGDTYWRFRSVGLVSQRASVLLLADALIVAGLLGTKKMNLLRPWANAHLGLAVIGLVAVVFFVIDGLGLRDKIKDDVLGDFFGGATRATITLLLAVGYCVLAGLAGRRPARRADAAVASPKLATDR